MGNRLSTLYHDTNLKAALEIQTREYGGKNGKPAEHILPRYQSQVRRMLGVQNLLHDDLEEGL